MTLDKTMKTIVLENDNLKIEMLPELGGKIISFLKKDNGFELAAQPSSRIGGNMSEPANFSESAYGMDDAFPNIDQEIVQKSGKVYVYPDHGEIWIQSFEIHRQKEHSVELFWKSDNFSYTYEKTLILEDETLRIRYRICNCGMNPLYSIWTWHGLVRYEEDMKLIMPKEISHYRNVLSGSCLGEEGTIYPVCNSVYDFSKVLKADTKRMVKYYAEESVKSGLCKIMYPSQGMLFTLCYDARYLPYLGVWITAGGYMGDYNCALEPSNGFYDSIGKADKNDKLPVLSVGETIEFEISLSLEHMNEI